VLRFLRLGFALHFLFLLRVLLLQLFGLLLVLLFQTLLAGVVCFLGRLLLMLPILLLLQLLPLLILLCH